MAWLRGMVMSGSLRLNVIKITRDKLQPSKTIDGNRDDRYRCKSMMVGRRQTPRIWLPFRVTFDRPIACELEVDTSRVEK